MIPEVLVKCYKILLLGFHQVKKDMPIYFMSNSNDCENKAKKNNTPPVPRLIIGNELFSYSILY